MPLPETISKRPKSISRLGPYGRGFIHPQKSMIRARRERFRDVIKKERGKELPFRAPNNYSKSPLVTSLLGSLANLSTAAS